MNLLKYSSFGIALSLTLYSIISVWLKPSFTNEYGNLSKYIVIDSIRNAAILLFIILIMIIRKKEYWSIWFGIVLIIANTPMVDFISHTMGIGGDFLRLELLAVILLILHVMANPGLEKVLYKNTEPSDAEKEKHRLNKVKREEEMTETFVRKFKEYDNHKLKEIVDTNKLTPTAVEAARRILKEKEIL